MARGGRDDEALRLVIQLDLTVGDSAVKAQLDRLAAQLRNPSKLTAALGREGHRILNAHFIRKDQQEPNKLSSRRSHFWRKVAQSLHQPKVSADGGTVILAIGSAVFAQKLKGGTIRAKRSKFLTIPVSEEAAGRTASTFEHETGLKLRFIRTGGRGRNPFSAAVLATSRGTGLQVEYVLKPSVIQRPDPTALPPISELRAALLKKAEAVVARETSNGGAQP